jgi:hypothetical protein
LRDPGDDNCELEALILAVSFFESDQSNGLDWPILYIFVTIFRKFFSIFKLKFLSKTLLKQNSFIKLEQYEI